jgi:hypothetical protein
MVDHGVRVFPSVRAALDAGYQMYDRLVDRGEHIGYIVRTQTSNGWAQAIVDLRPASFRAPVNG